MFVTKKFRVKFVHYLISVIFIYYFFFGRKNSLNLLYYSAKSVNPIS